MIQITKTLVPIVTNDAMKYNDMRTKSGVLLLVRAIGYGLIFLLSTALVLYLRHNRTIAFRGDSNAARKVILPAYIPLLVLIAVLALAFSCYYWIVRFTAGFSQIATHLELEAYYAARVYLLLLVVVYMYQKSVSIPALQRAAVNTFLLSTYTLPIVWLTDTYGTPTVAYYVPVAARALLLVFFVYVMTKPPARASQRTLREYCLFVLIHHILMFAYNDLFYRQHTQIGFTMDYITSMWGSLSPLVIWRVLKADTEHWRGLGRRAVSLQSLFRQKRGMNEHVSSQGLHVLIEMHRRYVIDFAYLELKHRIGTGASAAVFQGELHSTIPVAVKVYTPTELTDALVAEFSNEAALCGALHHPNIVKFYGMCVCPPTICLVSELCQGGLDEITKLLAKRHAHRQMDLYNDLSEFQHVVEVEDNDRQSQLRSQSHSGSLLRQQLLINLNYMIDATRAVAYLHSFSPAFVHRDIKPCNFLVDDRCVVKLTDFGESRCLPTEEYTNSTESARRTLTARSSFYQTSGNVDAMTVRGTAEYMAPEIIQGKAGTARYGEAADIFSLAMTLWDILHPLDDKYPDTNGNHLKVFEAVLNGKRPELKPESDELHPGLYVLLRAAWDSQPDRRPTAQAILFALESIHQEVCSDVAMVLAETIENALVITKKGLVNEDLFSGQALVMQLLEFDYVESTQEATRVGNGFMTAGVLHHVRHALAFENSQELYKFDMEALHYIDQRLYMPAIAEHDDSIEGTSRQSHCIHTWEGECASETILFRYSLPVPSSVSPAPPTDSKLPQGGFPSNERTSSVASEPHKPEATCSCRKLGDGSLASSKGHKRFRRKSQSSAPRTGRRGSGRGLYNMMTPPHSETEEGNSSSRSNNSIAFGFGLTEKLLDDGFTNTNGSAYSVDLDSPMILTTSVRSVQETKEGRERKLFNISKPAKRW